MASESERAREERRGGGQTCPITPKFLVISLLVFGHYLELLLPPLPLLLLSRILTFSIVIVVVSVVVVALLLLHCCCCCCTAVSC